MIDLGGVVLVTGGGDSLGEAIMRKMVPFGGDAVPRDVSPARGIGPRGIRIGPAAEQATDAMMLTSSAARDADFTVTSDARTLHGATPAAERCTILVHAARPLKDRATDVRLFGAIRTCGVSQHKRHKAGIPTSRLQRGIESIRRLV